MYKETTVKEIKVADVVELFTKCSQIGGVVVGRGECINGDEELEYTLKIAVKSNAVVEYRESEIEHVYVSSTKADKEKYLKNNIGDRYNLCIVDDDGIPKSDGRILEELLLTNIWDDMSKQEQNDFMEHGSFEVDDFRWIIDECTIMWGENAKLREMVKQLLSTKTVFDEVAEKWEELDDEEDSTEE